MKIFDRDGKYNFVDTNNVFVGYDSYQCCCEDFGYVLCFKLPDNLYNAEKLPDSAAEGYVFDPDYFESRDDYVVFRLVQDNHPEIFLILYNFHNGYYSHGFTMSVDSVVKQEGMI